MITLSKLLVGLGLVLSLSACSSITCHSGNETLTYSGEYETLLFTRCSVEKPRTSILPVGDMKCTDGVNQCKMNFKKLAIDVFNCASNEQV